MARDARSSSTLACSCSLSLPLIGFLVTTSFNPAALFAGELEELLLEPPSAESLTGDTPVRRKALFVAGSPPAIVSGVWEAQPGTSRWTFTGKGEFIFVLGGKMTVTEDGGESVLLGPGDAAVFPPGWAGLWEIHETLRKVMIVFPAVADG